MWSHSETITFSSTECVADAITIPLTQVEVLMYSFIVFMLVIIQVYVLLYHLKNKLWRMKLWRWWWSEGGKWQRGRWRVKNGRDDAGGEIMTDFNWLKSKCWWTKLPWGLICIFAPLMSSYFISSWESRWVNYCEVNDVNFNHWVTWFTNNTECLKGSWAPEPLSGFEWQMHQIYMLAPLPTLRVSQLI